MITKLAIISTHPIQYNAPLFAGLAATENLSIRVYYTWSQAKNEVKDNGFGKSVRWDIPLLDGYKYEFVDNIAKKHQKGFFSKKNPQLISRIKNWGADALLVYGWNFHSHLHAMRYFHGKIPVLFRGDSHSNKPIPFWKQFLRKFVLTWVFKHVDLALYAGKNNHDYFIEHGLKPYQLQFMPHAIDLQRFSGTSFDKLDNKALLWRRSLGIDDEEIVLSYIGKFLDLKNVPWILHQFIAFQTLHVNSKLKLLLVGQGEDEQTLRDLSMTRDDVIFLPFQNQQIIPEVYRLGDVLVMASKRETWGLSVNEAMACGRPVILCDRVGCAVDLVDKNENTGWIYPFLDAKAFQNILKSLTKEVLLKKGSNAKKHIQNWSYEKDVSSVVDAVKKLTTNTVNGGGKVLALFPNYRHVFGQELANMAVFNILSKNNYHLYVLGRDLSAEEDWPFPQFREMHVPYTRICYYVYWFEKSWFYTARTALCWIWKTNRDFIREYRSFRPDFLHVNTGRVLYYLVPALLFLRTKRLIYRLGDHPGAKNPLKQWLWRHCIIPRVHTFVCDSIFIYNELLASGRKVNKNDKVLYSPAFERPVVNEYMEYETKFFHTLEAIKKERKVVIGYWGRIWPDKGMNELFSAMEVICPQYPDVVFAIAGTIGDTTSFSGQFESKIRFSNFSSQVLLPGYIKNIDRFAQNLDFQVIPSYHESYGMVSVEAKKAGIASVIFPAGGLQELVHHQIDGYVCDQKNAAELIKGIKYYLDNRDLIVLHGKKAQESLVEMGISQKNHEKNWLSVYSNK